MAHGWDLRDGIGACSGEKAKALAETCWGAGEIECIKFDISWLEDMQEGK